MTDTVTTAADFAARIAATYGGTARREGREWRTLCPVHESDGLPHNPSLAIWVSARGSAGFTCMAGCPQRLVRAALQRQGIALPAPFARDSAIEQAARRDEQASGAQRARAIFERGMPLASGDASSRYLASRGIDPKTDEGTYLRTVRGTTRGVWLLAAAIVDPAIRRGDLFGAVGVQLTFLHVDGTPTLEPCGKKKRRIIGSLRGCGVILGQPAPEVVVGEGIETTWSAMRLLDKPFGIAALSALNLDRLRLPSFATSIVIASDNDVAGQASAERARARWRQQRRRVEIARWGDALSGTDANDQLRAECASKSLQRIGVGT